MRRFRRQAGSHGFSISLQGRAVVVGAGLPANGPHRGPSDVNSLVLFIPLHIIGQRLGQGAPGVRLADAWCAQLP